jgi:hypothetical protein
MANPTANPKTETIDMKDLAIQCEQVLDNSGNVLLGGGQQDNIAALEDAAIDTTDTYSDAAVNAALDLIIAKVNAIITALEDTGILADS